ncbi:MAG: hypothetical protein AAF580_09170 [Pseudomonadota bacterium]
MRRWGKVGMLQSMVAAGGNGVDRPGLSGYRSDMMRILYDRQTAAAIAILFGLASLFAAAKHQVAHHHQLSASSATGAYIVCEFHGSEEPATLGTLCEACLVTNSLTPAPQSGCLDDRPPSSGPQVLVGADQALSTWHDYAHRVRGPPRRLV